MPILLLLAGAAVLVGVVIVAMGRGGEMAEFTTDYLPPTMDDVVTAADVALLRPPSALWGYNQQATDEALNRIAQVITERDVEIAVLRQQLAELRSATGGHPAIAATLLARSRAATAGGARAARTEAARTEGARADASGSPGRPVGAPAAGPPDPGPGETPRSGEAAAGRGDRPLLPMTDSRLTDD